MKRLSKILSTFDKVKKELGIFISESEGQIISANNRIESIQEEKAHLEKEMEKAQSTLKNIEGLTSA